MVSRVYCNLTRHANVPIGDPNEIKGDSMQTIASASSHVTIDENGIARIDGTRMKVIHVIEAWKAGSSTPEALHDAYPHLTLAQIHSAFAYYYDHQNEVDSAIEQGHKEFEAMKAALPESPLLEKLRQQGIKP